jgi:NIPSNAP
MIWELRRYAIAPGRIADIHTRFRKHLPPLLAKHGICIVGRWTNNTNAEAPEFVYMMAYRDLAERESQWRDFYADPQWPDVRALSNGATEIIERIDISFLRPQPDWVPSLFNVPIGGFHELALIQTALGQTPAVHDHIDRFERPLLSRYGGQIVLVADFVTGTDLPKIAILSAWPDCDIWSAARAAIATDPDLKAIAQAQALQFGQPLFGQSDRFRLDPAADALPLGNFGFRD